MESVDGDFIFCSLASQLTMELVVTTVYSDTANHGRQFLKVISFQPMIGCFGALSSDNLQLNNGKLLV